MSDDIVARLRNCLCIPDCLCGKAADEIERLRELSGEAGKLRKERDEARCDACMTWAWMYRPSENAETEARKEAKRRSWDCFKEDKP
jgi:hypothetical protein